MSILDFFKPMEPAEPPKPTLELTGAQEDAPAKPVAKAVARPITINGGPATHERLVARAKGRIERLEGKLARQKEKGVAPELIAETEKDIRHWSRQLEYSEGIE